MHSSALKIRKRAIVLGFTQGPRAYTIKKRYIIYAIIILGNYIENRQSNIKTKLQNIQECKGAMNVVAKLGRVEGDAEGEGARFTRAC